MTKAAGSPRSGGRREGLGRSAKAWFLRGLEAPTGRVAARKILRGVGVEAGTEALDQYQHMTVERLAGADEALRAAEAHRAGHPEAGDVRLSTDEPGGARVATAAGSVLFGDGTEVRPDGTLRTATGVVTDARGEPVTVAPPRGERTAAGDALDLFALIRGVDVRTVNLPTEGLRVNERIRQFKEDADPKTGVVAGERLRGAFQPIPSKPILVMEFADGTREVVTGRHRLDLARQNGMATIPANLIYERDGWTPEAARVMENLEVRCTEACGEVR